VRLRVGTKCLRGVVHRPPFCFVGRGEAGQRSGTGDRRSWSEATGVNCRFEPWPALLHTPPMSPDEQPGPRDDPDVALMLDVVSGSHESFAALIRRHQDALLNFFTRMGAYLDGEDLVQETFLRVYRYRERYRPTARFKTFLYVLARHVWADRCRKSMRRERLTFWLRADAEIRDGAPAERCRAAELDVQAALNCLSPKLREVLVLSIYQGLRYQEIADILDIPLGTVKSRVNLALAAMRRLLDEP
jgi:RNA polymerase sigma-70 factor, ECF subfamily